MPENPQTPSTPANPKTAAKLAETTEQMLNQATRSADQLLYVLRNYIPAIVAQGARELLIETLMQSGVVLVRRELLVELEMRRKADLSLDQVFGQPRPTPAAYAPTEDDPRN